MGGESAAGPEGRDWFRGGGEHGHRLKGEEGERRRGGSEVWSRERQRECKRAGVEHQLVGR